MTRQPALPAASARILHTLRRFAWALCALALWPAAHALPLGTADELAVRSTVQGQLAAFAADDAKRAFAYAAPNVREALGTAAAFMAMVREAYPVVYRPASVAFLKPDNNHGQVSQRVQMVDATGEHWLATYSLQRSRKGWLITGCVVVASKARMA
jgi:hypothetical protein